MKKSRKGSSWTNKQSTSAPKIDKTEPTTAIKGPKLDPDDAYNSGFGHYLRSSEGLEMLKLFVVANSVIVILTMAWPNLKVVYVWIKEAVTGEDYSSY